MKKEKIFSEMIGDTIFSINSNNQLIDVNRTYTFVTEDIRVTTKKKTFEFSSEDYPHFYGEGNIDIQFETRQAPEAFQNEDLEIKEIILYLYKSKGLNFFARKNLVQIEYILGNQKKISIGFFTKTQEEHEFIATGEIFLNINTDIELSKVNNIEVIRI